MGTSIPTMQNYKLHLIFQKNGLSFKIVLHTQKASVDIAKRQKADIF